MCSLPSRYDICGGLIPSLSFFLPSRVLSFFVFPPFSFTRVISSSESSCYSFSRKDIRTRSRVTSVERDQVGPGPKLPARDYKPIISSQILRRASCGPKPAWFSLSGNLGNSRSLKLRETEANRIANNYWRTGHVQKRKIRRKHVSENESLLKDCNIFSINF